jgi:hypothetical protein
MPRSLAIAISVTDVAFILYWCLAAFTQFGVLDIPQGWMYANYLRADVIAWNWSFFPMDIAFSVFGLRAVAASRRGDPRWRPFAIVSLTLTMAAGGMAVSYWALLREFDPLWFISNLVLVIWPLFYMSALFNMPAPLSEPGSSVDARST